MRFGANKKFKEKMREKSLTFAQLAERLNGEYSVNPHFAMCNKEISIVGSWDYSADDYPTTMAFLRQAREMNIPIKELITHTYPLDKLNEAMEVNVSQQGIKICYVAE